jgi:hypothetical protein
MSKTVLHAVCVDWPDLTKSTLAQLIHDLDDDTYTVRERAARELARYGAMAAPELRSHLLLSPSLESRRRVELLLRQAGAPASCPEFLRSVRILEALERGGGQEEIHLLRKLREEGTTWMHDETHAILQRLERRSAIR